jgi:hypothetical protein
MIRVLLLSLFLLSACNTAGPEFAGIAPTRVTVDGSAFDVRVAGERAEALRVNPQYAPRFGPIRARAAFAMAQVSGCRVLKIEGDQAQATAVLSCSGRAPDRPIPRGPVSFSCLEIGGLLDEMPGGPYSEYDCDPY